MRAIIFLSCLLAGSSLFTPFSNSYVSLHTYKATRARRTAFTPPVPPLRIIVDKSSYDLKVYDVQGWYATYPVVFGSSSLGDKKMEGDKNTPEGNFKIISKRYHQKWDRYLGLNYPTEEDIAKFNQRKMRGEVPKWARPGAGIGIHGTWPHEDFAIDRYSNWTDGCISLKREDIEELYSYVPIGTPVTIKK